MTQNMKPAGRRGPTFVTNEAVYQCYVDLCGSNPPVLATRRAVVEQLGVPMRIIDEHTDRLLAAGRLRRVLPGVFEPVEKIENRAVSFTAIPGGGAKIEIGDQVLHLQNMREGQLACGLIQGWFLSKRQTTQNVVVPAGQEA